MKIPEKIAQNKSEDRENIIKLVKNHYGNRKLSSASEIYLKYCENSF